MAKRADLEPEIRQLFRQRPDGHRADIDVNLFYGELHREHPELLRFRVGRRGSGDKIAALRSILRDLIDR